MKVMKYWIENVEHDGEVRQGGLRQSQDYALRRDQGDALCVHGRQGWGRPARPTPRGLSIAAPTEACTKEKLSAQVTEIYSLIIHSFWPQFQIAFSLRCSSRGQRCRRAQWVRMKTFRYEARKYFLS